MITINGQQHPFKPGLTVLEAATEAGVYIPTLCNHPRLPPFGACRLCIVQIDDVRGLPTACTTPLVDGMNIRTESEDIQRLRREIMKLILSEHPSSCLICKDKELCEKYNTCSTKAGKVTGCNLCSWKEGCEVRKIADYLQIEEIGYPVDYHYAALEREDPFFDRDYNLCILCGRCVRVCEDIRGIGAIAFLNRGHSTRVGTAFGMSHLDGGCMFCGACVDVCPTAALTTRATKWLSKADRKTNTTCNFCGVGCSITIEGRRDTVMRALADNEGPANQGQACVLGRFCIPPFFNALGRLRYPMVRREGLLTPVSWEEALAAAAQGLGRFGPDQVRILLSTKLTNETAYLVGRMASEVLPGCSIELESAFDAMALRASYDLLGRAGGTGSLESINQAEVVLIVGADLCLDHSVLQVRLNDAHRRGARVIWLGPMRLGGNRLVDHHYPEARYLDTLAGALRRLAHGVHDLEGADAFLESLLSFKESETAKEVASLLKGRSVCAILGKGIMQDRPEAVVAATWDLLLLTQSPQGLLLLLDANSQGLFDLIPSLARPVTGRTARAFFLTSGGAAVPAEAEFVVLQDIFEGPMLERADVVLPATGLPEDEGTMTSLEGRVQAVSPIARPPGLSMNDWSIVARLSGLMGGQGFGYRSCSEVREEMMARTRMGGLGLAWRPVAATRLCPVDVGGEPTPLPARPVHAYRGADIVDKVSDLFRLYRYRGVLR
ncbi:MAG: molybdopterin-dependent oxidoreductase [Methanomassiliicoccales archaeon]|jgi:predicted molibdopterin-dependent oxidoreductase YjgC|nr:molybdopterin-dependent oxidoreductase [Methanomassiliicoccales archaeon]